MLGKEQRDYRAAAEGLQRAAKFLQLENQKARILVEFGDLADDVFSIFQTPAEHLAFNLADPARRSCFAFFAFKRRKSGPRPHDAFSFLVTTSNRDIVRAAAGECPEGFCGAIGRLDKRDSRLAYEALFDFMQAKLAGLPKTGVINSQAVIEATTAPVRISYDASEVITANSLKHQLSRAYEAMDSQTASKFENLLQKFRGDDTNFQQSLFNFYSEIEFPEPDQSLSEPFARLKSAKQVLQYVDQVELANCLAVYNPRFRHYLQQLHAGYLAFYAYSAAGTDWLISIRHEYPKGLILEEWDSSDSAADPSNLFYALQCQDVKTTTGLISQELIQLIEPDEWMGLPDINQR